MKQILIVLCGIMFSLNAFGACTSLGKTYTRCNAPYYLNGDACAVCPSPGQSDGGTGNVTSCHVPAGTGDTDSAGTWEYAYDCHFEP